jgi:hypothetical protein
MSIAPPRRPMPDTMGGVPTNIRDLMINPFDRRSPFEKDYDRMMEAKERRQKGDEARAKFRERVGSFVGGTLGSIGGGKAGAALGTAAGGPIGGVIGGVAGSLIGGEVGEKASGVGRMAGDKMRTAFGGGAITGDMADRRSPTEEMVMGNPMAAPTAADFVKMPQDLQAGYMHLNRFGSPLPIHGLATPGRTTMAQDIQDGNFVMQHRMQVANRDPIGMSRVPFMGVKDF